MIVVSFGATRGGGNVSLTIDPGAGTEAQFIADVAAKRAKGKKVILSLGGQNGSVSVGNTAEATNFTNSLYAIITKYGFDGIDLDLENGVAQGAAIQTYLPIAVKNLKAKVGSGFYLSMAPEWVYVEGGLHQFRHHLGAYIPIINALRSELTVLTPTVLQQCDIYTPYATGPIRQLADQLVPRRHADRSVHYGSNPCRPASGPSGLWRAVRAQLGRLGFHDECRRQQRPQLPDAPAQLRHHQAAAGVSGLPRRNDVVDQLGPPRQL